MHSCPQDDRDWHEFATLEIGPHPGLSEDQRKIIALDYGMRGGKAKIQVRKAFLYYTLRRLGIAHRHAAALWLSLALLGGVLLTNLLKLAYERPRPDFVSHAARVFTSSFPSGHATLSAITYLTLGALLASLHESFWFKVYFLGLAVVLTIAIGISRIYLGVHYPTDVLAGWCIGAAWAGVCWSLFTWLQHRGRVERSS